VANFWSEPFTYNNNVSMAIDEWESNLLWCINLSFVHSKCHLTPILSNLNLNGWWHLACTLYKFVHDIQRFLWINASHWYILNLIGRLRCIIGNLQSSFYFVHEIRDITPPKHYFMTNFAGVCELGQEIKLCYLLNFWILKFHISLWENKLKV